MLRKECYLEVCAGLAQTLLVLLRRHLARRITESKHLLETSDHPVSEIGLVLGFSSASYFSQRFKKAVGGHSTGIPPHGSGSAGH